MKKLNILGLNFCNADKAAAIKKKPLSSNPQPENVDPPFELAVEAILAVPDPDFGFKLDMEAILGVPDPDSV